MSKRDTKVIGYFAYISAMEVICTDVDACVIAGSKQAMKDHLTREHPQTAAMITIRKTRFGEILQGLSAGAAYGFDRKSYSRFYPLAKEIGIDVSRGNFDAAEARGDLFFTVRLKTRPGLG